MLELWLFRSRWLMAPFYIGLTLALAALLYVFAVEIWHELSHLTEMNPGEAILLALSLIDLSLTGNLVLIVIFSGYQNFVSKIDADGHEDWPAWMGAIDYSGLKMKLIASVVAISAIALLNSFLRVAQGEPMENQRLAWLVGLHLTFVVSALILALIDFISGRTKH
ncbi:TIGR00645 family protein [Phenylobacterium sp. LjRoot219]|uniref:TIGR00645 family protein n=1 Tax=Phenylobacterium sp. LjRoot219 TaxID=3342283 RepID=UPI003F4F55E5